MISSINTDVLRSIKFIFGIALFIYIWQVYI